MRLPCSLLVCLLAAGSVLAANPVRPTVDRGLNIHIQEFATLFGPNDEVLKVNTMATLGQRIFVTTEQAYVYEITGGNSRLAYDFKAAWQPAAGRPLNFQNGQHSGLRGIAFSPNFTNDRHLYTAVMENRPSNPNAHHYLSSPNNPVAGDAVVSEWTIRPNGQLNLNSYRELFRIGMPVYDHPVKDIAFGPDGMLYVTHGDGSVQSATAGGGFNNDALGKILRIDPTRPSGGLAYTIPSDNPFVGNPNMLDEVWSLGHRNPHTLSFSNEGLLFVGEAGRDNIEEINLITKGGNYGWSEREGTFVHLAAGGLITGIADLPANDKNFGYVYPVAQFGHDGPQGAGFVGQAIAGGSLVENGSPADGEYFYIEFSTVGDIYHININDIKSAVTSGDPCQLRQAQPAKARIWYDHDKNPSTPARPMSSYIDVFSQTAPFTRPGRSDARMGKGPNGEIYILNGRKKRNAVHLITTTVPGGAGGFANNGFIEAELGRAVGGAGIKRNRPGYSGVGFVDSITNQGSGVEDLIVEVVSPGTYTLTVRYAQGVSAQGTRKMGVNVDGKRQGQINLPYTGGWNQWRNAAFAVKLVEGQNNIGLLVVNEANGGRVTIDRISLSSNPTRVLVEAECGTPFGGGSISNGRAGFTGTGFVENLTSAGSGVRGLTLISESARSVTLTVRYAMGNAGPPGAHTLGVRVNGVRRNTISFTRTGSWMSWSTKTVNIPLVAGVNSIELIYQNGRDTGWVNIDHISTAANVTAVCGSVVEAESGNPRGSARVASNHAGHSGSGYIDNITQPGSGVNGLSVSVPSKGCYKLDFHYASAPGGTIGVIVNGQRQAQLVGHSTGGWKKWGFAYVVVTLNAGANTVHLRYQGGQGDTGLVNIDYFLVKDI